MESASIFSQMISWDRPGGICEKGESHHGGLWHEQEPDADTVSLLEVRHGSAHKITELPISN